MSASAATNPASRPAGRPIPPVVFGLMVIAIFGGTILAGAASGWWLVSGRTTADGERVVPQGGTVTEIKGWMAIGDVADAWNVPLPQLLAAFNLAADTPPATPLKDLETETFSVTGLRTWLAERGGADNPTPGDADSEGGGSGGSGDESGGSGGQP